MPRFTKQLTYGFGFFLLAALIAGGAYVLLKPSPSCFDGKQNQKEEGVDCGGPCARLCAPAVSRPIELVDTIRVFSPVPGRASILFKIQNQNFDVAAKEFSYRIELYGEGDALLTTVRGTSFAYAREVKYLAEFVEGIESRRVRGARFVFESAIWARADELRKPALIVRDQSAEFSEESIWVTGRLANEGRMSVRNVSVIAVFYSKFGIPAGVSRTIMDALAVGETREFFIVHPATASIDPSRVEISASTLAPFLE